MCIRDGLAIAEPPPPPPTSADVAKLAASTAPPAPKAVPLPPKPIVVPIAELPPPPPTSADIARLVTTMAPPPLDLGKPDNGPPPPTSADIARVMTKTEPPKPDPDPWPATRTDQIRAIQVLLGRLKLMGPSPTGEVGPITLAAIRDYQQMAGMPQNGEPSRELFESLKTTLSLIAPRSGGKAN